MHARVALLTFSILAACAAGPLLAQAPEVPPGYTAYQIVAPGVGVPPLPFKIEGDRFVAPEGSLVQIGESHITETRVTFVILPPGDSPARFVGIRKGDVFEGLITVPEERLAIPAIFAPADREVAGLPDLSPLASAPGISRIEIVPAGVTLKAGERQGFVARVFDENGAEIPASDVEWYGGPGSMSETGEFVGGEAGDARVFAIVGEAVAMTTITVTKPDLASLSVYTDVPTRLAVGSRLWLDVDALDTLHRWDLDPEISVASSAPAVVEVMPDGSLAARSPGSATITLGDEPARRTYAVQVVPASGTFAIRGAPAEAIWTGDVASLSTSVADAHPAWSVVQPGAAVWPPGDFVAEKPGTYTVVATLGDRVAETTIEVLPREVTGTFHVVGRGLNPGMFTADIWPQNGYVYLGTHQADQIRTYDVSDPANPVLTDSITVDARVINSVKVSRDGRWLAATREGAASRRNGIILYSLEDPAHPRMVSEYTETVTSGVHNVFWATDDILYLTNDGTGDMNIIDVSDPANPREVGRWGLPVPSKTLHDIWAQDGILWMSYMNDGLVILDIGGGGQGGTPEKPVMLSRLFYPDGPTHNAFRYGDYLFLGDEDFSSMRGTKPSLPAGLSADPRGEVHVIDVSDLTAPRYVARYEVPEAGAHNLWIQDGIMYVGFYQGGIRAVDVSGALRGDLYRQGREIAHFLPQGTPEDAKIPYAPQVWGVFPMFENGWKPTGDVWFVTDYNSGLWVMRLEVVRPERPIS